MIDSIEEFLQAFKPKPSHDYHRRMQSMPWTDEDSSPHRITWIPSMVVAVVMMVLFGLLVVLSSTLPADLTASQGFNEVVTLPVGTATDDTQGDIRMAHADVVHFDTYIHEEDLLVATFTMNDLPDELPSKRDGVEEGKLEFEWRISIWWSGFAQGEPDFYMAARYFSGRAAGGLAFLNIASHGGARVSLPDQQGMLPESRMPQVIYDGDDNTITFEVRLVPSDITNEAVVTFEVFDILAGTDTPDHP